jgi:alkylation response protein AidB-like acyl-CoA dehydrogenase
MEISKNKGGAFLISKTNSNDIFSPDEWTEEQIMIASMCSDFVDQEVIPNLDRIDAMEDGLMVSLLDKAGELGLLGLSVPEEFGGMGVDFKTSLLATEYLGKGHSFSVAYGAHTGIGSLPLLYYGNQEQKAKYAPLLASGEWKAAYCLTEPSAGSDANSGKTKAKLNEEGTHYILNGQKMWITNGGFADLFTVFAKIDDDSNLSAFLVEAKSEGISLNPEEKKMGIKGSSTRQVFFNNVKVPVENLLSERGNGFKIALNILNIGRIKLAAGVLGGSKETISDTLKYAKDREQFGRSINKYGAIRAKIAEQVIRTFVLESATYRAAHNIEDTIETLISSGLDKGKATLKGIEEFAAECAMLKVAASECLDFVVDEAVQIYGGMGYSAESSVERSYRDSRINRIFEGTNEINRMLSVDMLLKKGLKGELDLLSAATKVGAELMSIPDFSTEEQSIIEKLHVNIENFKKSILLVAGVAVQKLSNSLGKEQEILMNIADMLIWTYQAESALLRVEKLISKNGLEKSQIALDIVRTYIFDSADRIAKSSKDALNAFVEGDELTMMLMGIRRFTKVDPFNSKDARQRIALHAIDKGNFSF